MDELKAEMLANKIDLLVVDPFVSSHAVSENDNNRITVVKNAFADIASATGSAVELVHHVRKGASGHGGEHTIDDARGAGALVAGARSARILNAMSKDQAEKAEVQNPRLYFNVTIGKANLAPPPEKAQWCQMVGVALGNGGENVFNQGDSIGVAVKWEWPDALADVTVHDLRKVQAAIEAGRWRESHQSDDWVGNAVAGVLGLDPKEKASKRKILSCIKKWTATGMLVTVNGEDDKRNKRKFVEVGTLSTD